MYFVYLRCLKDSSVAPMTDADIDLEYQPDVLLSSSENCESGSKADENVEISAEVNSDIVDQNFADVN